jgi:tRNA1Val (adenine37-N6)-methyltransferase
LIFSNPPFYENSLINSDTRKAKAKHESHLSFYLLFEKVSNILSEIGTFWIIMPYENANKWIENAAEYRLYCIQKINIFAKPNSMKRTILVFSKIKSEMLLSDFIIRNNDNSYSDDYIQLTKEFHSKVL